MSKYTMEMVKEAGHDEDADKVLALCNAIDCGPDEVTQERHDCYGLSVYSVGRMEYAIGTDDEADDACGEYVRDSLWAFNASFILSECGLPYELQECIASFQSDKCESANDAILALVRKCTTLKDFTRAAISADGRGHFLSSYDGEEIEAGEFFAYRVN